MSIDIDISVVAALWDGFVDAEAATLRTIAACEAEFDQNDEAELSVVLCDDAEIRRLNNLWRGKDYATNVLSFPTPPGPTGERHLGDIVIAYETVVREAQAEGKSFSDHFAHLLTHGYLHLSGYDHETEAEAEEMEQLEREILAKLGIADPYAGTTPARGERQPEAES